MKTLIEIRAEVEADTPAILHDVINGASVDMSGDDRAAIIDAWAQDKFGTQIDPATVIFEEKAKALPDSLMAEFRKLSHNNKKKWYVKNSALKVSIREALRDGEILIARELIAGESLPSQAEKDAQTAMLALLDDILTGP